jgi:WD40 repeat protein
MRIAAHSGRVQALLPLQCGYLVSASGGSDGSVKIWDEASALEVAHLKCEHGHVVSLALFSGAAFVSGSDDGRLQIWDANRRTEIKRFAGHQERITALAILPDGRLASASIDGTIRRCISSVIPRLIDWGSISNG